MKKHISTTLPIILAFMMASCSPGKVFKSGSNESKPTPIGSANKQSANLQEESIVIMVARYRVSISSVDAKWDNLCNGIITAEITSDFKQNMSGEIKCDAGMTIPAAMLNKGAEIPTEKLSPTAFPEAGMFARRPNPAQGQPGPILTPNFPSALGPIIQDPSLFEGYRYSEKTQASGTSYDGSTPISDVGAWELEVLSTGGSFTSSENPELVYDNIINWQLKSHGFHGGQRNELKIFDLQEFWINTNPIAIPKMVWTAKLADLMPPGQLPPIMATLGAAMLGTMKINVEIIDEERL